MDLREKARPYRTANDFYRERFGTKVYKIALNGDFTCPNRDGTTSREGCLFCSEAGAGEFAGNPKDPLSRQFAFEKDLLSAKWPKAKYIAYFQANTNTYAPLEKLNELYETALGLDPDVVGLDIATRPDCLPPEVLDYLEALSRRTFVAVELGLQTIHPDTARRINRGYPLGVFEAALAELRHRGIHAIVHVIDGLPGETLAMMRETAAYLSARDIQGIKIHMLSVLRGSPLERIYGKDPFPLLSREEYVGIVADQIERLRPEIVLYRITGDPPRNALIAPAWTMNKMIVTNEIDKEMRRRGSWQGCRT